MNLFDHFSLKSKYFHITDRTAAIELNRYLLNWLPNQNIEVIILCIGSDKATGDSLGPLTGTFIQQKDIKNIHIFGTLAQPVHALNLNETIRHIEETYNSPYIIAIDACLGKKSPVGTIILGKGPLKPGKAFNKDLPVVGDLYISGIVNTGRDFEVQILQTTRLYIVMEIATLLAESLYMFDKRLSNRDPINMMNNTKEV